MLVVMLDLDGVLNHVDWFNRRGPRPPERSHLAHNVDPICLGRLNRLCQTTGAKIVFSSTWRYGYKLKQLQAEFKALGFTGKFIGMTPKLLGQPRGAEIGRWLDGHPQVSRFVILDDDTDMLDLWPHLIRTDPRAGGLLDEHVELASKMLGG